MPQLQRGSIYMEPREEKTLGGEIEELTNLILQMKLKEYLLQKQADIRLGKEKELLQEKYKLQGEHGGAVNIVDPTTGEVKTIYVPGGGAKGAKTYLGKAAKAPPKLTPSDLEDIAGSLSGEIGQKTGYLSGFPGVLEKFMPFGGVARKRGMEREFQRQMAPYQQLQREQFQPPGVSQPTAISPSVKPGTIVGKFTGGGVTQPAEAQIPPDIAEQYPDAYQGPDGEWYVDKDGQTFRIERAK